MEEKDALKNVTLPMILDVFLYLFSKELFEEIIWRVTRVKQAFQYATNVPFAAVKVGLYPRNEVHDKGWLWRESKQGREWC